MKSKRTKAAEFSQTEREKIKERDRGCIFCRQQYRVAECKDRYQLYGYQIMHYIPRSHGGLGIARNGAVGCLYHHNMLDNGNKGNREEMLAMFRQYLQRHYRDWNESDLTYRKEGR